ncbi:hypothetical protein PT974_02492 [Cladobotryum mycophilum]|uniref:C3H1-type domain-containing protein n=1 Tax=Cladobotryum mycophilum TaxID=491253 RepID=A0ABR0SY89_9HYPO
MSVGQTVRDFVQRFHTLQAHRDSTDALIKDLVIYCNQIEIELSHETQRLKNSQLDLADATNTRRELQQRIQVYESRHEKLAKENDGLKNRNPYIMVLIDGDGLIFQEKWIKQGVEGGKKAAYALRNAISERFGGDNEDIEVVAKVVANLSGLAKAMQRDGSSENQSDMKDFTLGFTQAKASFDFVDVGYGKERADSKIKELTRWNLRNHNCKQIVLGISHDAGYAPFLDEIFQDDITRQRVSILEGVSTVKELVATEVGIIKMEADLFRKEKLIERTLWPNSYADHVICWYRERQPPPQITFPLALKPLPPPRQKSSQSSNYQLVPPQQPDWNPGPRGLDEPIKVNILVLETIKKRKDTDKLCNNHYLRGPCAKRDVCQFVHDYRPSEDEIKAIAVLARQNPCTSGQYCELDECIYGHHCPSVRDGVCIHPFCKFSEESHPPGTKYKNSFIRAN